MRPSLLVALYDMKSQLWYTPFPARSEEEAMRMFGEALKDRQGSLAAQYPADFSLYVIGTWDAESGEVGAVDHKLITTGDALLRLIAGPPGGNGAQAEMFAPTEGE